MHWACKRDHIKMIDLLLEFRPNLNQKDLRYHKPLFYVLRNNNHKILIVRKQRLHSNPTQFSFTEI